MSRLNNKLCVITGAANGIGKAIATAFKNEGATVIVTDIDEIQGAQTASELGVRFEKLDVRSETDWQRLEKTVPSVDVVVNNAGITGFEERL